ncbi:hypothetical protein [Leifsonia sp. Leaf336]|uniref:hypothetical protein n=1 Tax=Leifsonia sp. Leaf336 TaxID=1736341 RepID=UPI0009EAE4A5|nr:hypothetical protein [Leifsonia sp. Leaf336]
MLLTQMPRRRLGVPENEGTLRFAKADSRVPFSKRYLFLEGTPAFELSLWCGTCPFLFERKDGANGTLSRERERLSELEGPLDSVSADIIQSFGSLLPIGDYLPLLLEVRPQLVAPTDERDYFTHEQVDTWGVDSFWGLPENPRSFYYRTFETEVDPNEHLYEFIVPMVPPGWNDQHRVSYYLDLMRGGTVPTAVALSTLDICQPATDVESIDYYAHWGLTHFLLDGHHKVQAAAELGVPLRLLAFVSLDDSLARPEEVARVPELLSRPSRPRPTRGLGR